MGKEYTITCPYCFAQFSHTKVHFRSERVNKGEWEELPDRYDDIEHFKRNYNKEDKEQILERYNDWAFFQETTDFKYEKFWEEFGGTTEVNPADSKLGVVSYYRKVIDPSNPQHQKYLKIQANQGYLGYDADDMVAYVELLTGENCSRRVCPECHNPLPHHYGKHPVKFTTVIGITGAGKTVFLSQLIKNIGKYVPKIGMSSMRATEGARLFLDKNKIKEGDPLPGSTPPTKLLQPLFYDLSIILDSGKITTHTFVLYDVAGENCVNAEQMEKFGKFIKHADGIFLLIDPFQFECLKKITPLKEGEKEKESADAVLDAIHRLISQGKTDVQCDKPIAVCIPKSDMDLVQELILGSELSQELMSDVTGIINEQGYGVTTFNAKEYNGIAQGIHKYMLQNEIALEQMLHTNYSSYNYFAFTALGCNVVDGKPEGPIHPRRIEEALFWLFHEFGYINENEPIFSPGKKRIMCPTCAKSDMVKEIPEGKREIIEKKWGGLKKIKKYVSHECLRCNLKWNEVGK